jgi:hypothetical protein
MAKQAMRFNPFCPEDYNSHQNLHSQHPKQVLKPAWRRAGFLSMGVKLGGA